MSGRIFISYRRGQDNNSAGRIYDALVDEFGESRVFMDVDTIPPGVDFVDYIDQMVGTCDAFLAVIGPGWHDEKERLHDEGDFVHLEIRSALKRENIRIVPLLVSNAEMPTAKELPKDLHPLLRRSGLKVSHQTFNATLERLSESLEGVLAPKTTPVPTKRTKPLWPWLAGAAAVASTVGGLMFATGLLSPEPTPGPQNPPSGDPTIPVTEAPGSDPAATDAAGNGTSSPSEESASAGQTAVTQTADVGRFALVLLAGGPRPIAVARKVEAWTDVSFSELKSQMMNPPQTIVTGLTQEDATNARKVLSGVGAVSVVLPYPNKSTRYYSVRLDTTGMTAGARARIVAKIADLTGNDAAKFETIFRLGDGTVWVGQDREQGRALVDEMAEVGIENGRVVLLSPRDQPATR
ncbi:MAG: toll/interleukin-1 receptor domain-containing protein [Pseudomonadota bacterium]